MTDEQKSLDYGVKNVCTNCAKLGECGKGVDCDFLRIIRDCYEEAIKIGREEEIENKDGIITSQSDALNKEYFINESLNSQLKNICKWKINIEDTLNDYENGKYDNNEHQFVVDAFMIMNGILNDIRSVKYE